MKSNLVKSIVRTVSIDRVESYDIHQTTGRRAFVPYGSQLICEQQMVVSAHPLPIKPQGTPLCIHAGKMQMRLQPLGKWKMIHGTASRLLKALNITPPMPASLATIQIQFKSPREPL